MATTNKEVNILRASIGVGFLKLDSVDAAEKNNGIESK